MGKLRYSLLDQRLQMAASADPSTMTRCMPFIPSPPDKAGGNEPASTSP